MTTFLHFANVLYLIAYLVRDILWLRIIAVVAMISMLPYYYYSSGGPQWAPISWQTLFLAVNIAQIAVLILERRPVFLGEEELALYRSHFHTLRPREFMKLLSIAEWKKAKRGDVLLEQAKPVPALMLISAGYGTVNLDDRHVAEISAGQFIGEMGFLTNQAASARVVAGEPTDYLSWPVAKLRALLANSPALHVKVQAILGTDLVAKLRHDGHAVAHPSGIETVLRHAGAE
jgi:hypothetical protein